MRKVLYLMGVLDDADIDWLAAHGTVQFVKAGNLVVEQGLPVACLRILLEGSLSVFRKASPDRIIKELFAGEVIGEISFVDSRPPTASVRARVDSRLLVVDREVLIRKLERDQGFAARFYRALALFLADRLRSTMGSLGFGDGDQDSEESVELDENLMDNVALGATRFDRFLHQLRVES
jgi:CRP/FNR family transcriptional regulator, cyclic AMP receptor protein